MSCISFSPYTSRMCPLSLQQHYPTAKAAEDWDVLPHPHLSLSRLTWPLLTFPSRALPSEKGSSRKSFWFTHKSGDKLLSFQHSPTTTFRFLYLLPTNQLFLREIVPFETNKISACYYRKTFPICFMSQRTVMLSEGSKEHTQIPGLTVRHISIGLLLENENKHAPKPYTQYIAEWYLDQLIWPELSFHVQWCFFCAVWSGLKRGQMSQPGRAVPWLTCLPINKTKSLSLSAGYPLTTTYTLKYRTDLFSWAKFTLFLPNWTWLQRDAKRRPTVFTPL